jgi:hypothetical protein
MGCQNSPRYPYLVLMARPELFGSRFQHGPTPNRRFGATCSLDVLHWKHTPSFTVIAFLYFPPEHIARHKR